MRTLIMNLLAAALLVSSVGSASAFEINMSVRGGLASSYTSGALITIDVFFDAPTPGITFLMVSVISDVAGFSYSGGLGSNADHPPRTQSHIRDHRRSTRVHLVRAAGPRYGPYRAVPFADPCLGDSSPGPHAAAREGSSQHQLPREVAWADHCDWKQHLDRDARL